MACGSCLLAAVIAANPAWRVLICHAAKPEIEHWSVTGPEFRAWAAGMKRFAALGCWVKVSGAGTLAICGLAAAPKTAPVNQDADFATLDRLTITDAAGHEQALFFGDGARL